jgi:hypothetical protein
MQIGDFVLARKAANPHLYAAAGITKAGETQPRQNCQAISIIHLRKWSNRWRVMPAAERPLSRAADA